MDDLTRALRRLSGCYVPYLEPYWNERDVAAVDGWLKTGSLDDVRDDLTRKLRSLFPESADVILTDTGKTALFVALNMLDLGHQDEVIVPSYCCSSIIASVLRAGCVPVLADCDEHFNISEHSVAVALSPKTKAVLVVYLFGTRAASLDAIITLAKRRGIAVIEDVAQAFGLRLENGSLAGSVGDAAIFSAGLGKPITGPGGGWVVMNRTVTGQPQLGVEPPDEARRRVRDFVSRFTGKRWRRGCGEIAHALPARLAVRMRHQPGFDRRAWAGNECRVRGIAAIDAWLTLKQIERIDDNIERRRQNAERWSKLLAASKVPCRLPTAVGNIYTVFPLWFEGKNGGQAADQFRRNLERGGIATEPCYVPLHLRVEARDFRRTSMDVAESLWRNVFAVSIRPNLSSDDWQRIGAAVTKAVPTLAAA